MLSKSEPFQRRQCRTLVDRLNEPRRFMQVVAGPRQTGKTTLVLQALKQLGRPHVYASADEPALRDPTWIAATWERARLGRWGESGCTVLALDEIQKILGWSETVKRLWDEDTRAGRALHVILLGSSPLLVHQGLTESLAGRFEVIRLPHWGFAEMQSAFGVTVEAYVQFGGYPGAASLQRDAARWRQYILEAMVEPTIARDVLLVSRVDKPALLRRLFDLGCRYSGQILSYTKLLGQLQDAGNTVTLAHYLELLEGAGMLMGLQKYAGEEVRQRASSPKLQVLNTALVTAAAGLTPEQARSDPEYWGRLCESAVGAHLANAAFEGECEVFYWRDRGKEVDFVLRQGRSLVAIEVKSGRAPEHLPGMAAFAGAFRPTRTVLVGGDGIPLAEFLTTPVRHWLA